MPNKKRWRDPFLWLVAICVLLVVVDEALYFFYPRHGHLPIEEIPAIYGVFGFVVFFLIVIAGKYFRKIVKRREDYYDE